MSSNWQIARDLGVSDNTVGAVRRDMEVGAQIAHHKTRIGKDGISQPDPAPIFSRLYFQFLAMDYRPHHSLEAQLGS